jgi:hypothetical protein
MPLPAMTTTQQFTLTLNPTDKKGKPAPVDGEPTWASSDENVAKVVPNPGGMSALVVAVDVGDYSINVSADADLGEGVETITVQDSGGVSHAKAASLGLVAGPIEEQPE